MTSSEPAQLSEAELIWPAIYTNSFCGLKWHFNQNCNIGFLPLVQVCLSISGVQYFFLEPGEYTRGYFTSCVTCFTPPLTQHGSFHYHLKTKQHNLRAEVSKQDPSFQHEDNKTPNHVVIPPISCCKPLIFCWS